MRFQCIFVSLIHSCGCQGHFLWTLLTLLVLLLSARTDSVSLIRARVGIQSHVAKDSASKKSKLCYNYPDTLALTDGNVRTRHKVKTHGGRQIGAKLRSPNACTVPTGDRPRCDIPVRQSAAMTCRAKYAASCSAMSQFNFFPLQSSGRPRFSLSRPPPLLRYLCGF